MKLSRLLLEFKISNTVFSPLNIASMLLEIATMATTDYPAEVT